MYLVTANEMRELDSYAISEAGLPGVVLMENAGRAVVDQVMKRYVQPQTAVILAGTGNNGGDGWVTARHLLFHGWKVHLWMVGDPQKMTADARVFYEICLRYTRVNHYETNQRDSLWRHLQEATVVVDALLGTGTKGELRPLMAEVTALVNRQEKAWVIAVDLPTGVDADTGAVSREAIQADCTVTFAYPKWGHYLRPGADYCGELQIADIGLVPCAGTDLEPKARLNLPAVWHDALKSRSVWSHKGTHGHLLVIGGSRGMLGAVTMAGEAAYRTGAGLVTLTVPDSQETALSARVTQELVWSWPGTYQFSAESSSKFAERKERFTAVAIGPGLGRFHGEEKWLGELMQTVKAPLVLDADALNICAEYPSLFQLRLPSAPTVLTPHPGEMARLLGCTVGEVERDRPQAARELSFRTGAVVVLKGRHTLISFPNGKQLLNLTGSPALAKAGSGDLLTGMIGSFLAQHLPVEQAVPLAVYLHGKAGETENTHSFTYADLLSAIGPVLQQLLSENVPA